MTLSAFPTDQPILKVLIGTDRDRPVMVSKSDVLSSIKSMARINTVG